MEPTRKSVYDILIRNLKLAGRRTYIHRYLYVGEHKDEKETEEVIKESIKSVNEDYCAERCTGLLLLYPHYFVHIVDGCEDAFARHVFYLFTKYDHLFGNVRLIGFYHHINQRFFDEWGVRRAKPPILLEKIDPASGFEELKRYLHMCLTKIYNLAIELRQVDPEKEEPTRIGEILPSMSQYLPEYNLLQYIVNENEMLNMRLSLIYSELVLESKFNLEQIWPVRNDYVPYNVFETLTNPIQNLPNTEKK